MKKIITILALALTTTVFAQAPQKMSYQAIIRNSQNQLLPSTKVGMQISVLQGSADGKAVYVETQNKSTNTNGLVSLEIGMGKAITGSFSEINWAEGPYFIKTETDPNGGSAYSIIGTTELMSVPYALFAANVANTSGAKEGKDKDDDCCCFKHYLGEEFNGGIIFNIYKGSDGKEHGLIVAKTESVEQWNTFDTLIGADRSWDGVYNTMKMGLLGSTSNAYNYVTSLGAGWYIPSIDELNTMYQNRIYINKALHALNLTLLGTIAIFPFVYGSSTEYIYPSSIPGVTPVTWTIDMTGAQLFYSAPFVNTSGKTGSFIVRAIKKF